MDASKAIAVILAIPLIIFIASIVVMNIQVISGLGELDFKNNMTLLDIDFLNKRIDIQHNFISGIYDELRGQISDTNSQIVSLKEKISEKDRQIVSLSETIKSEMQPFEQAAEAVASAHEYDVNSYNCVNFSDDLVSTLETMGYDGVQKLIKQVDCFAGIFDQESCSAYDGWHEFVMVPIYIEATAGTIIEPEDYWVYDI